MSKHKRIGEVARLAEVTPRTIRYYESIGLLPAVKRKESAQRTYSGDTVERLRKIDQLKLLGLSLDEIHGVIDLYFSDPSGKRAKVKVLGLLRAHLAEVDRKAAELMQVRTELAAHVERFEAWLKMIK